MMHKHRIKNQKYRYYNNENVTSWVKMAMLINPVLKHTHAPFPENSYQQEATIWKVLALFELS